jgi:hypothetical protein
MNCGLKSDISRGPRSAREPLFVMIWAPQCRRGRYWTKNQSIRGGSNMRRRLRVRLVNALLVTVSVLLTYAIAEVVFFRVALPYLSLSTLPHIPDRAAFFLQGSKREYVPHDYIALVGDSNAQGMGDC